MQDKEILTDLVKLEKSALVLWYKLFMMFDGKNFACERQNVVQLANELYKKTADINERIMRELEMAEDKTVKQRLSILAMMKNVQKERDECETYVQEKAQVFCAVTESEID